MFLSARHCISLYIACHVSDYIGYNVSHMQSVVIANYYSANKQSGLRFWENWLQAVCTRVQVPERQWAGLLCRQSTVSDGRPVNVDACGLRRQRWSSRWHVVQHWVTVQLRSPEHGTPSRTSSQQLLQSNHSVLFSRLICFHVLSDTNNTSPSDLLLRVPRLVTSPPIAKSKFTTLESESKSESGWNEKVQVHCLQVQVRVQAQILRNI